MLALNGLKIISMSGDVLENATILIAGNEIKQVGSSIDVPQDAQTIDCTGKTAIPGMIDAHVHICLPGDLSFDEAMRTSPLLLSLRTGQSMLKTLLSGTTTIRDLGGIKGIEASLKRAVAAKQVPGPRLQICGKVIAMTGGHGYFLAREADGPDEVRKAAREQIREGADWIKLMGSAGFALDDEDAEASQLDVDELTVAVQEGQKAGKPAAAHAHPARAIKDVIKAGVASVEHCSFLDEESIDMLLEHDVAMVPTFTVYWQMMNQGERTVPKAVREAVARAWEQKMESFGRAARAGVKIVTGTDSGPPAAPHGNLAKELELLVEGGLSCQEALAAATTKAAELLQLADRVGTITPGKLADIAVLDSDPLEDIKAIQQVHLVIKDGAVYDPKLLQPVLAG